MVHQVQQSRSMDPRARTEMYSSESKALAANDNNTIDEFSMTQKQISKWLNKNKSTRNEKYNTTAHRWSLY